jgi:hypothetical protein
LKLCNQKPKVLIVDIENYISENPVPVASIPHK